MYYNKEGKKITLREWGKLFEDWKYKRIGLDNLPNGYRVSTVWLGLDHSFTGGEPLIFETMVFNDKLKESAQDCDMERYSTLEQAIKGHKKMVKKWKRMK